MPKVCAVSSVERCTSKVFGDGVLHMAIGADIVSIYATRCEIKHASHTVKVLSSILFMTAVKVGML